jgi:hypothetical protein
MSLEFDDLPVVESAGRSGRRAGAGTALTDTYRIDSPGAGVELSSLHFSLGRGAMNFLQNNIFPSSSQLAALASPAAGPNYTTYNDCGGFHYGGGCNNPCFGFAPDHMSTFFCATCAEQAADPTHNPYWNWHYTGSRGQFQYRDDPGNPCNGRDAWKWKVGACGTCHQSAIFRCHDGYKKFQNGPWEHTICQGLISCDGNLTHCP